MKYRRARRTTRRYRRYKAVTLRSKLKQERRRRLGLAFAVFLGGAAVVATGWWGYSSITRFLFSSERFRIRAISVNGGKNVTESEILALLPFRKGDNLLRIRTADARRNLSQCRPELKSIRISRGWDKVSVRVEERLPVACVVMDGQRLGIDDDNKPFPLRGSHARLALPEIACASSADRREVLKFIKAFAPRAKEVFPLVARFSLQPVSDVVLELKDGSRIFWGSSQQDTIEAKLRRLAQVMEDARARFVSIEYINLSYFDDGRILVRPRKGNGQG